VSANNDTQPALETNTLMRLAGADRAGVARLGLRWVFPILRELPLRPDLYPVIVGRDGDGQGLLEGNELSRRHAELRFDGGQLVIRDLESRNGIFVNAQRRAQAVLRLHDVVRLGGWVGVVVLDGGREAQSAGPEGATGLHLGPTARQVALPARQLAATNISMVLEGETGTGKERFARAIHEWSGRKGPLVAINCAAVPESLAEAELFGYREGAFTGAIRGSAGHFRAAHGGTLFLDEVTDMPWTIQAKVLRALEQKEILPVGESQPVPVDVRILAATQTPLEAAVTAKRLRADFHARLDGYTLRIPPLRERRDDIPSLFTHLLARHGLPAVSATSNGVGLSPRLVEALCAYGWPLNVRELDFLAQRLAALQAREPVLRRSHLPDRIRGFAPPAPSESAAVECATGGGAPTREQLLAALTSSGGNLARAAEQLEISRQKAYRILGSDSPERLKDARRR
jgi:DNA-binding NtrC family response regulator